ncbi:amidase family protein [Bulleidia sp. zg-1006]|uniref:amidase family protein n=1 Tax=Bulleidia sp. zg-1006 TaxID=2806552 RepID=UPI0019399BCA|nr:amidase family protein [Bulleidia sp. zg-1006]QRG86455.1 Asp-tRNA(Asn)/Glu-tRNA(Gln) amidotransferase subunit GatA [Bulleidia sp. zg-1006]
MAYSKEQVLEAYEKAKASQEKLNAVITFVNPTEQLGNLGNEGKLLSMPIAVKDNVNTKGVRTTAGSRILENYVPIYDATIMKKLNQAGAITIAKTSMDELAMGGTNLSSFIGPAHNPWDESRITGGSSGGSAALVAAGVVPMAIGSDTGDSVRKPASYCGVVGVKPTYGRISRYGVIPYASSLDHVGYFTGNIADAALTLEVLSGRDEKDMTSGFEAVEEYSSYVGKDIQAKKIGILGNVYHHIQDKRINELFDKVVSGLKEKGAIVEMIELDEKLMAAIYPSYMIIANCEATSNHSNLDGIRFGNRKEGEHMEEIMVNTRTEGFGEKIRKRFVVGSYGLQADNQERVFRKAQKVRRQIVDMWRKAFQEYDAIIAPAAGTIAPKIDEVDAIDPLSDTYLISENYMAIANFAGTPSITQPMGFVDGMPAGINLNTDIWQEGTMFQIGEVIEEITGLKDNHAEVK